MKQIPEGSLWNLLEDERKKAALPLHMPGHKRNSALLPDGLPWHIDVTEVAPFDNLQNPEGILKECQGFAADLWKCKKTFFLVGGSSAGVLAGIRACTTRGDKILISRGSHISVYHAIELCGLRPIYLNVQPVSSFGFHNSITPEAVYTAISQHADIKLAVITSPTYEGVLSDISAISSILHEQGIPLFVDAAHGAHLDLPFAHDAGFPAGALRQGADLVVHSLHKTLPALTQTALLHVNSSRINLRALQHQIHVFQSSSPSYPLMASIDFCNRLLASSGERLMQDYRSRLRRFYSIQSKLKRLTLFSGGERNIYAFDPGKLIIGVMRAKITGNQLARQLANDWKIKTELASAGYLLGMTSLSDEPCTLDKFADALLGIDRHLPFRSCADIFLQAPWMHKEGEETMPIEEALARAGEFVSLNDSIGCVSQEYIWQYPPGIPVLAPGQEISKPFVEWLSQALKQSELHSTEGKLPERLRVIAAT